MRSYTELPFYFACKHLFENMKIHFFIIFWGLLVTDLYIFFLLIKLKIQYKMYYEMKTFKHTYL